MVNLCSVVLSLVLLSTRQVVISFGPAVCELFLLPSSSSRWVESISTCRRHDTRCLPLECTNFASLLLFSFSSLPFFDLYLASIIGVSVSVDVGMIVGVGVSRCGCGCRCGCGYEWVWAWMWVT